ncbi:peptidoglycan/LPS O-acetylase OafA/YrhL [Pseudorhodoferax soli]|uniref:Peptidoglycan/LPS O-acetylase OafA/YrhL n=2 Tax=Pseudorhodoferax soli TaxID=545864 RepID=A0A368Y8L5_9BURK|nr:peptidoglycan/LPS O-acetylase OafA/YrhL [Pseudorhodoferax soli]
MTELAEGRFNLIAFYERRARRILPALFLVLAASAPLAWWLLSPRDLKDFSQGLVAIVFSVSNVLFWLKSDYFSRAAEYNALLHTWSLGVEEQFYIFFPLILAFFWSVSRRSLVYCLAAAALGSLLLAQYWLLRDPMGAFFLLPFRAWELLGGALAALTAHKWREAFSSRWGREVLTMVGMLLLLGAVTLFRRTTPFPGGWALVPVCGTLLIILFADRHTLVGSVLCAKPVVWVGLVSYSAYLWHVPIFSLTRYAGTGEPHVTVMLFLCFATILLAWATWRFVEVPFRSKSFVQSSGIFKFAGAGFVLFFVFGFAGHLSGGFERLKLTDEHRKVLATAASSPMRKKCHAEGADFGPVGDACKYHGGLAQTAVFGDSHAVELAYALADALRAKDLAIAHFSFSGCVPALGRSLTGELVHCSVWTKQAVDYIASQQEITNVVVSYRIHAALFGDHEGIYPAIPDAVGESERALRWKSYVAALQVFLDHGKNVVLVLQAPELPKRIDEMIMRSREPLAVVSGISREWWDLRTRYVREHLSDIPAAVKIVDPTALFCDALRCVAADDGQAFYFDDDHPSVAGARVIATEVVRFDLPGF